MQKSYLEALFFFADFFGAFLVPSFLIFLMSPSRRPG